MSTNESTLAAVAARHAARAQSHTSELYAMPRVKLVEMIDIEK